MMYPLTLSGIPSPQFIWYPVTSFGTHHATILHLKQQQALLIFYSIPSLHMASAHLKQQAFFLYCILSLLTPLSSPYLLQQASSYIAFPHFIGIPHLTYYLLTSCALTLGAIPLYLWHPLS